MIYYQGSHRDFKTCKVKIVMEKSSWNIRNLQKVMEFADINKFSIILESLHFPTFSRKMSHEPNIDREMAMENREMVMEK